MKEFAMLMGFGIGLVTGALMYKYSQCTKELVSKGENAVMKEVDNLKKTVKKANQKEKATQSNESQTSK